MVRETGGDVAVKSMVGSCVGSLKSFQKGYFYDRVALSAYLPSVCVCVWRGGGGGGGGCRRVFKYNKKLLPNGFSRFGRR